MDLLQLTKKKEIFLLIISLTALVIAFVVKSLELENQNIAIFILLISFLSMTAYLIFMTILEKDKLIKWTLIVYSTYIFSVISSLLSYIFENFFDLHGILRFLSNLLGILYWPATLMVAISLFYLMRVQKTLIKFLYAFTALSLIFHLAKGILGFDIFLNSIGLNENVLLIVATLAFAFTISSIDKNEIAGIKGIMTILFMNTVYVLIKSVHQYY